MFTVNSHLNLDNICTVQRPEAVPWYFRAPGSPCHESTSSDNSTSMRIWLGRKESQCEGILPVSLHRWHCQQHHYLSSSSSTPSVTHYEMWNKRKFMRCSIAPWKTEKHSIIISKKSLNCKFFLLSIYLYMVLDILKVSNQTPPPTLAGTWQGLNKEKKRSIPLSLQNLSMSWV